MTFIYQRSYCGPLQGIILDWAGTTIDYGSQAPAMVFVEVFQRQGVGITLEEAHRPMGKAKWDHILDITHMAAVAQRWQAVHGRLPVKEDVDAMYEAFIPLQVKALVDYAFLIPGTKEAVAEFRQRGLKVGSNTGYNREMVNLLLAAAAKQDYIPNSTVCADDVPAGRPAPWMALQNAREMGVYPMEAVVKVDDTLPGLEAGLNAGMWTIGVAKTGNELGLNKSEVDQLPVKTLQTLLKQAYQRMYRAGVHYVVDGIWDVPVVLDDINRRLAKGERP